uniref:hypothetical protein n=1 Tax=Thaumasiovibrio occultus TaxID=1891184 RepID=UPI000B357733|nr:hypothetical protein [Thaumasiovibrio occultus]
MSRDVKPSLSVCIQALQTALAHYDWLVASGQCQQEDMEEAVYMYEHELAKLIDIYRAQERRGEVAIPLKKLLQPPYSD